MFAVYGMTRNAKHPHKKGSKDPFFCLFCACVLCVGLFAASGCLCCLGLVSLCFDLPCNCAYASCLFVCLCFCMFVCLVCAVLLLFACGVCVSVFVLFIMRCVLLFVCLMFAFCLFVCCVLV